MIFFHPSRFKFFDSHPVVSMSRFQLEMVESFNEEVRNTDDFFEEVPCLCGFEEFDVIASNDRYGLTQQTVMCRSCGLILSNPRMTAAATEKFYESDRYRAIYEGDQVEQISKQKWEQPKESNNYTFEIFSHVERNFSLTPSTEILEFGAGAGSNLRSFVEADLKITGIDYSPQAVEIGRRYGVNMVCGGLEVIRGKYDIILINHVLEHFLDPIGSLKRLKEHLKEDGIMFIAVPNISFFNMVQIQNAHAYYFVPENFKYFVSAANMRMIDSGPAQEIHMYGIFKSTDISPDEDLLILAKKRTDRVIWKKSITENLKRFLKLRRLFSRL
jgi:2-polyprenyl-3-methyl-5-hydroxy-6-metoxy-1,4-benzoquinol methylase